MAMNVMLCYQCERDAVNEHDAVNNHDAVNEHDAINEPDAVINECDAYSTSNVCQ